MLMQQETIDTRPDLAAPQSAPQGTLQSAPQKEAWMLRPLHKTECHIFEHKNAQILYEISSGTFFEIDQVVRDILDLCDDHTLIDLLAALRERHTEKEILSAFRELYSVGVLQDVPEPEPFPFSPPGRLEIVHLGVDITYDSLTGKHLFTRDPNAGSAGAYMHEEVARKAIDLLMKESGRIRQCHVTFQGGDPLLNAPLVERVIDYGLERARELGKEIYFEVQSESRLLNAQLFHCLKKRNADIIVKMDTAEPDELPLFGGAGPFSLSSSEVQDHIQGENAAVHIHGVVDRRNLNLKDHVRNTLARGSAVKSITLKFSPLPPNDPNTITEADLPDAIQNLEDLADYVKTHVLDGETPWIGDFEDCIAQVFNRKTSFYHCGAGTRYLTVSPDGNLSVCPGLVGNKDFQVGDVQNGIDRKKQRNWVKSTHVEKFEACSTCWARYLCGGGCRLNSVLGSDRVDAPNPVACSLIRRTYELAMGTCLEIAYEDMDRLRSRYAEDTPQ